MIASTKVVQIGNSVGLVLSKEAVAKLRVAKGDTVYITETPRGLELSPYDPDFAAQMEVMEGVMNRRRNLLRKLAE